jgi:iron only hydrogenase large subunit-like protein
MAAREFYHALRIEKDKCIGCTHCIRVCPTQALRVVGGKAVLFGRRCVDCGECMQACPVDAITVAQDDFSHILGFKIRIAIIPAVLYGQFSKNHSQQKIVEAIKKIGFTHIYEAERSIPVIIKRFKAIIESQSQEMPLISSFCPAIVRLIQVRFPSLVRHIAKVKPPVDLTAIMVREQLRKVGWKDEEVGIFYVTPCAAKIAAVKSPVGEESSYVDGVININSLYNKIYPEIKAMDEVRQKKNRMLKPEELLWSLTRGESVHQRGRVLAVDGIKNAIDILEKIENGEVRNLDFLELRACDEGCAGGVLNVENRFLAVERLNRKVKHTSEIEYHKDNWSEHDWLFLEKKSAIGEILPRPILSLDDDFRTALEKMDKKRLLTGLLPSVDCGVCGSPDCETFAEDIVHGRVGLEKCVFTVPGDESVESPCNRSQIIETWSEKKIVKIKKSGDESKGDG